jgi:ParB family chromosome partitioning protein
MKMEKKKEKMYLPSIDDLFTTQKTRDEADLEKVVNIKLNDIDDFPEHPFKVIVNDELKDMAESIKEKGVLSPALVRQKDDGRYEMISGHRRKKASELANKDTIPCIVRDLTDDEATIIMVDSNMQREKVLPSEKAFAYKMKLDALSHQGKRTDLTSDQVGPKLSRSNEMLSNNVGESVSNIKRYIRLTYLIPELLDYVDNSIIKDKDKLSIALSPAVEISYLSKEEQQSLLDYIDFNQITPSQSQAISLKEMSQNKTFTVEKMEVLLNEEKPNQTPTLRVSMNKLRNVLPKELKNDREREDYDVKAVEFYDKYQKRMREKNSQER